MSEPDRTALSDTRYDNRGRAPKPGDSASPRPPRRRCSVGRAASVGWLILLCLSASWANAMPMDLIDPMLAGTSEFDEWASGSLVIGQNPGYPGFPGSGAWPAPIGSSTPGSGDADLMKTANGTGGGPYPAGSSLYYGGFSGAINNDGGELTVSDATPVAGIENITFQVQIGEAWTYDFFDDALPTLSYNGGTQALAATDAMLLEQFYNGTITMPSGEEDIFINTHLLQWDVTGLGITEFEIEFNGVQHGQTYAIRLDQSDTYVRLSQFSAADATATPEPTTWGLVALGLTWLGTMRRRRRK